MLSSVLFWRFCSILTVLFYSGGVVLFWRFCSILAVLFYSGGFVLFWWFCSILAVLFYSDGVVLFWQFCSILAVLFYSGSFVLFWQVNRTEPSNTIIEKNWSIDYRTEILIDWSIDQPNLSWWDLTYFVYFKVYLNLI